MPCEMSMAYSLFSLRCGSKFLKPTASQAQVNYSIKFLELSKEYSESSLG